MCGMFGIRLVYQRSDFRSRLGESTNLRRIVKHDARRDRADDQAKDIQKP